MLFVFTIISFGVLARLSGKVNGGTLYYIDDLQDWKNQNAKQGLGREVKYTAAMTQYQGNWMNLYSHRVMYFYSSGEEILLKIDFKPGHDEDKAYAVPSISKYDKNSWDRRKKSVVEELKDPKMKLRFVADELSEESIVKAALEVDKKKLTFFELPYREHQDNCATSLEKFSQHLELSGVRERDPIWNLMYTATSLNRLSNAMKNMWNPIFPDTSLLVNRLPKNEISKSLAILVRDPDMLDDDQVSLISNALLSKGYEFFCMDSSLQDSRANELMHYLDNEINSDYDKILLTFVGHGARNSQNVTGFTRTHMEHITATVERKSNKQFYIFHACFVGSFVRSFLGKISQNAIVATTTGLDDYMVTTLQNGPAHVVVQFLTGVWTKSTMNVIFHAYFGEAPLSNPSFKQFQRLQNLPKENITLKNVVAGLSRHRNKIYLSRLGANEPNRMSMLKFVRGGQASALEWGMIPTCFDGYCSSTPFRSLEESNQQKSRIHSGQRL